tara:strand:- start:2185 stop:2730 length:546 start_codon:yes stop_codon:yes gene_type:complete
MKHDKIKNKSLISKYKFLKSDLEWKNIIVEETREEFIQEVSKKVEDINALIGEDDSEKSNTEKSILKTETESLKKIYWNICKITHPDKDVSNEYEDVFKRASLAYSNQNAIELFEISDDLNIKYQISKENMKIVNKNIKDLEDEIASVSGTYVFKFNQIKDEKEREKLINMFILVNKLKNK